jgi:hypothetical protein
VSLEQRIQLGAQGDVAAALRVEEPGAFFARQLDRSPKSCSSRFQRAPSAASRRAAQRERSRGASVRSRHATA